MVDPSAFIISPGSIPKSCPDHVVGRQYDRHCLKEVEYRIPDPRDFEPGDIIFFHKLGILEPDEVCACTILWSSIKIVFVILLMVLLVMLCFKVLGEELMILAHRLPAIVPRGWGWWLVPILLVILTLLLNLVLKLLLRLVSWVVTSVLSGPVSTLICGIQFSRFDKAYARWHHAAIYVGNMFLCEATGSGVGPSDFINKYLRGDHDLLVVRHRKQPKEQQEQGSQSIHDTVSHRISVNAMLEQGTGYGYLQLFQTLWYWLSKVPYYKKTGPWGRGDICSLLCYRAYNEAGVNVPVEQPVSPAELSRLPSRSPEGFCYVSVRWVTVK